VAELSEAAFGDFYRRDARAVWTYVYRSTGNPADADDIVQEAFVRVLRADVGGLGEEDLRRYLFRVAGNLMTDRWRKAAHERKYAEREAAATVGVEADLQVGPADADPLDVSRTFDALKPRERALLWLAYVEEDSHEEIADALGVKKGSVKVLLSRARGHLRDLLRGSR
jgi:RNA polymerase sigma factor (sigma-70 family)